MVSIDEQFIDAVSNSRDINIIKELILNGADVNYIPLYPGLPPLSIASMYGLRDVCNLLLDNGANVNYKDRQKQTALLFSTSVNIEIMKLLLEYGSDAEEVVLKLAKKRNKTLHIEILEEHIFQKKLILVKKRLALSKLFYSDLGKFLMEGCLYEDISLLI